MPSNDLPVRNAKVTQGTPDDFSDNSSRRTRRTTATLDKLVLLIIGKSRSDSRKISAACHLSL
jgi:hypothetical protein